MKILICAHEYYPKGSGIANLVYHLKNCFLKKGNSVKICSPIGPDYKIGSQILIEKFGGIGIIYFWYKVSKLLEKIADDYDIIYLHNPFLFKKINKKNIICVTHTLYYFMYKDFYYKNITLFPYYFLMIFFEFISYRIFLKNFEFVVTSKKTIKELKFYKISKIKKVIPNGVNIEKDKKCIKLRTKYYPFKIKNKYKLLFVGRLEYQKNLFNLLSVYKKIKEKNDKFILILVGEGKLKNKLIKFCRKNHIEDCYFIGKVPHKELLSLYNLADFFVLSSYYEGFPLTLSEALGSGLIPVLSPIEIFVEIKEKTKSGIILDFSCHEKSAEKFLNYFNSINIKKERLKIISIARKYYTWEKICQEYLKLK